MNYVSKFLALNLALSAFTLCGTESIKEKVADAPISRMIVQLNKIIYRYFWQNPNVLENVQQYSYSKNGIHVISTTIKSMVKTVEIANESKMRNKLITELEEALETKLQSNSGDEAAWKKVDECTRCRASSWSTGDDIRCETFLTNDQFNEWIKE